MENIALAFGLTLVAGLATGLGSLVAFFVRQTNYRFLSLSTGFSAGVMLYVSFVEILLKGGEALASVYGPATGQWINVASFFGGIALIAAIDALIPGPDNPHQLPTAEETAGLGVHAAPSAPPVAGTPQARLLRMGLFTAFAIALHNFPEGLATFLAALHDPTLGGAIALALALHNIPEGISVAVPIYYATGSRTRAFLYSFLSGLAEPIGAGIAFLGLRLAFSRTGAGFPPQVMGILFAGVAGIMVYVSLDELLPTSHAYGRGHESVIGLVGGMATMALTLILL
ncbi:MAG TPA: zinc transporter ZupT [Candidatus Bipolaricaulis anaerobius]|nr:zinc transporter ZupT [Candidatus Bipolaricaulis sp.]MDD3748740.1 zinc transporter ZupT [Candidatus Bipolaricaulis anaerobius]MDD5763506.1 zinc transporter ZupT [Candidatus Bipolaricaulis anaerobius]HNR24432.1 zinc transporter ZupT [Candidatus Bipolaricaulis anaerobius]HNS23485.1 zinc transporter ZupT [Candidatus Bipolaricaulis anaerobius]